jgi:hypothetical protein
MTDRPEEAQGGDNGEAQEGDNGKSDEFRVRGEELLAKVKDLIREGNIRRIVIDNEDGDTILEIPVTVGVVGAALLPPLAAVGAIAAVVTNCTIRVERKEEEA